MNSRQIMPKEKLFSKLSKLDKKYNDQKNFLLLYLKRIPSYRFEASIEYILEYCINVNRTFSDAIEFLSIWIKKSCLSLLESLKRNQLQPFFYRTEYDREGDSWYFPSLLSIFVPVVGNKLVTSSKLMDYLFSNFGFLSMPEIFIPQVIGYGKLEQCVNRIPDVFKPFFLIKIADLSKKADIGRCSYDYLMKQGYLKRQVKGAFINGSTQTGFFSLNNGMQKADEKEFNRDKAGHRF